MPDAMSSGGLFYSEALSLPLRILRRVRRDTYLADAIPGAESLMRQAN